MCCFQWGWTGGGGSPGGWIYGVAGILDVTGGLVRGPGGGCGCWAWSQFLSQPQGGGLHPEGFLCCPGWAFWEHAGTPPLSLPAACDRCLSLCGCTESSLGRWEAAIWLFGACTPSLHPQDEWEGNKPLPMALGIVHGSIYCKREHFPRSLHCHIYEHP